MSVSSVSGGPRRPVARWLVTWLVAFLIVLGGLNLVALAIGGSIGPLEFATAVVVGVIVAMRREGRGTRRTDEHRG